MSGLHSNSVGSSLTLTIVSPTLVPPPLQSFVSNLVIALDRPLTSRSAPPCRDSPCCDRLRTRSLGRPRNVRRLHPDPRGVADLYLLSPLWRWFPSHHHLRPPGRIRQLGDEEISDGGD